MSLAEPGYTRFQRADSMNVDVMLVEHAGSVRTQATLRPRRKLLSPLATACSMFLACNAQVHFEARMASGPGEKDVPFS